MLKTSILKTQWHSKKMRYLPLVRKVPLFQMVVLIGLAIMALFPSYLAPYDPNEQVLRDRFTPPFWEEGGSMVYFFGTDNLGRDILSRIIYGARVSIVVACLSLLLGGLVGTAIGLISGYFGGRLDAVLMRFADSTLAFPMILFAFLLAVVLGPSMGTVVIAIALVIWARYARIIRGEVLSLKERDFVKLAKVAGCSSWRIIIIHIFPNVVNTLVVLLTLQVGWVIIVEASLSFLGAGIPPPTAAWGSMIAEGRQYIVRAWWVVSIPGAVLVLTVLTFNGLGDWLRDLLDPKLRPV
jgi:peptide/nickel transport system permease protein